MKNRHLIIIVLGCILIWQSYMLRYSINFINLPLWVELMFVGFIVFIITLIRNIIRFRKERRLQNFFTTYLILVFAVIIWGIEYKNQYDLNKPTLLKVYYDGDFNAASLDFKTDGTFIFNDWALGMSDYTYGTYTILGNQIILNKKGIENIAVAGKLEIREKPDDSGRKENYLYQMDKTGNILTDETQFRVIEDNRK